MLVAAINKTYSSQPNYSNNIPKNVQNRRVSKEPSFGYGISVNPNELIVFLFILFCCYARRKR